MQTKTYILAFWNDLLIATVPTGGDLDAAVAAERSNSGVPELEATHVEYNVRLTDEPDDDDVIYSGGKMGWLIDETGRSFRYAVR